MVLLTSSAVSAALSGAVVCAFTFLLFLSGYILQQRTVRSLQEALRNPPEKPWFPTPTLPPQFQQQQEQEQNETLILMDENGDLVITQDQSALGMKQVWYKHLESLMPKDTLDTVTETPEDRIQALLGISGRITTYDHLAYILTIPETVDLCAAVLFVKWHRQSSKLNISPNIVFVYPAHWEASGDTVHVAVIDIIREMQDTYNVVCHPVSISRIWLGVGVNSQLLGDVQRTRWPYDRALYLRAPGMLVDVSSLDSALATSDLGQSWQPISPKTTSQHPELLLYSATKGLLAPRADTKQLTAPATISYDKNNNGQTVTEAKLAAYITFSEEDLEHHRRIQANTEDFFAQIESERREICPDAILPTYDDDDSTSNRDL